MMDKIHRICKILKQNAQKMAIFVHFCQKLAIFSIGVGQTTASLHMQKMAGKKYIK